MIAVVFDMDGVLFDTQKVYLRTWREVGEILQIESIEEPAFLCIGRNRNDQRELLDKMYHGTFPYDEFYRLKDKIFMEHLENEGVPLMKGTKEILCYLKSVNAKVAIASSTSVTGIMHHLDRTGLTGYFKEIVGGNLVTHSKPAPEIYLKACELLDTEPSMTYAVEDSYNGVKSAVAAGLKTIMIPDVQPALQEYIDMVYKKMDSLLEFKDYLKEEA